MSELSISLEWNLQEDQLKSESFSKNHKIEINNNADEICFNISAKSFLHSQVRIMIGTLVDIAKGNINKTVLDIINSKQREIAGQTACVMVRDGYLGMTFLDTLSFLKVDGRWKIYNKLYHVEKE